MCTNNSKLTTFVIKTNTERFNDVAPGMKLERAIQLYKKGAGGITG